MNFNIVLLCIDLSIQAKEIRVHRYSQQRLFRIYLIVVFLKNIKIRHKIRQKIRQKGNNFPIGKNFSKKYAKRQEAYFE